MHLKYVLYSFHFQELSPRGKRKLEFKNDKPLKGRTYYLDLQGYRKISSLQERIRELGGVRRCKVCEVNFQLDCKTVVFFSLFFLLSVECWILPCFVHTPHKRVSPQSHTPFIHSLQTFCLKTTHIHITDQHKNMTILQSKVQLDTMEKRKCVNFKGSEIICSKLVYRYSIQTVRYKNAKIVFLYIKLEFPHGWSPNQNTSHVVGGEWIFFVTTQCTHFYNETFMYVP